jgi:hypothetical protein
MSKLELSINVQYLPSWGAWEGIRELVQNGKDAETEFDAPLKVTHYNGTLRIENEGAVLSREALLFGTTSKADRVDMIGKFGEGLKLGILALVRAGHKVRIRTGSEVWTAFIAKSERYGADVLWFDCVGGREDKRRVRVEIDNVSAREWEQLRERFLFLGAPGKDDRVATDRGELLLDTKHRGNVFVKGIFVTHDARLNAGYNFFRAEVDRDRKMVAAWDQQWYCSQIWMEAAAKRPDLLDPLFRFALEGKPDVLGLEHSAPNAPKEIKEAVAAKFVAQFGRDAVPVGTLAESAQVEHLGRRGVVVSKPLGALLATTLGDKEALQKRLREEVVRTLSWHDLTFDQRSNLTDNIELLGKVREGCTLDLVDVVEFRASDLRGQYKDGRILLASRVVADRDQCLATLIHEFAHRNGGDGEKSHVAEIEATWRDLVKYLRGGAACGSS